MMAAQKTNEYKRVMCQCEIISLKSTKYTEKKLCELSVLGGLSNATHFAIILSL
jgi:hypothetical protein